MRIILILAIACAFHSSCKKGEERNNQTKSITIKKNNVLFDDGFNFTETIRITRIELSTISETQYKLLFFFDEESDFNTLQDLNIAFRVYPNDFRQFRAEEDRLAKAKTIGSKCKLQLFENELVVESENFMLLPKEFHQTKVFLYDPSTRVVGRMMIILNLDFH